MGRKWKSWLAVAAAMTLAQPAQADSFFNQGTSYLHQNQFAKAIACFDHSLKNSTKFAPAYLNRGVAYMRSGHFQKGLDDFLTYTKLEPSHYVGYSNAAGGYLALHQFPKAIDFLTKGIERIKQDRDDYKKVPSLYYERAHIYFMMRDYKKALADCQTIRSMPSQQKTKTFAEATKMAVTCQQGMAQQLRSYQSQATSMIQKGEFDNALKSINEAIEIEPKSMDSYPIRARAYAGLGQFDKAHQDIAKVVAANPKDSKAILLRSEVHVKQRDYAKALKDIEEAFGNGQKSYELLLSHALLSILANQLSQAQTDIDEVLSQRPKDPKAIQYKALLSLYSGKSEDVVPELTASTETAGWNNPAAFRSTVMAYEMLMKQGKPDEAKKVVELAASKLTANNELLWPAPAVSYLAGKSDPVKLILAARTQLEETEAHAVLMMEASRASDADRVSEHKEWIAKEADPASFETLLANRLLAAKTDGLQK